VSEILEVSTTCLSPQVSKAWDWNTTDGEEHKAILFQL